MPFKPNYRQDRVERTRSKQARKMEKLRAKEEQTALRKGVNGEGDLPDSDQIGNDGVLEPMKGDADAFESREEKD